MPDPFLPNLEAIMRLTGSTLCAAVLAVALLAPPSIAQEATGTIAQTVVVDPLPGHGSAFEEGVKAHMENMLRAGDESVWVTYEVVAGERSGQFMVGTFDHAWADFDQAPPVDPARAQQSMADNISPHVQDFRVQWMERMVDLGGWTPESPRAPMYEVITFQIRPGQDRVFEHFLTKLKGAMAETGSMPAYSVFLPVIGGGGGQWAVSVPHQSFAEFGTGSRDWMEQLLVQVYGHADMQTIIDMADSAIESSTSELFVLRPDLSMNLPPS
jgi:hypothetical protein